MHRRTMMPCAPRLRDNTTPTPDAHDRSLILERLAWTPEQRLQANAMFLRFYLVARPRPGVQDCRF
jgi:hypothetical protein